ncbi:hypothetical protein FHS83_000848 [Rhizomicrobium palustre]|uniref:Uncharacterized protein n=1 Tax=Rhizomicrobium palustre TaxID=189966 RepID=A0A846MWY0_9PROT|nr:hypothetical protein [Rhizomicrobium palustre]NIK87530.1 hypothetical protein [Rhizomicrobium palustre]
MYMDGSYSHGEKSHSTPPKAAIDSSVLRAMVRGELPVHELSVASIRIGTFGANTANTKLLSLRVSTADLAEGLMNVKDDEAKLTDWASFILVAADLFAFEDENADCGHRLLACIWDLAFGAPISPAAMRLADVARGRKAC